MVGMLLWKEQEKGTRAVTVGEWRLLHMRFLRAEVARNAKTPGVILRRRLTGALKQLRKQGVSQLVLPEDFSDDGLLEKLGLGPVSTLGLRRRLASDWVRSELEARQLGAAGARVAVASDRLTGEVVRTVTELALRHRYVLVDLPRGGEDLCRQLRREYGVSLLQGPVEEQAAEALVLFDRRDGARSPVCLRLYDETQPLPRLSLAPVLEERLPAGAARGQLLTALQEAGVLRPGQISVEI